MKTFSQFLDEALASFFVKAVAKSIFKNKALTQKIAKSVAKPVAMTTKIGNSSKIIAKPRQITGFQTARGSKYTYQKQSGSWPQTQRTAPQDPYHSTAAGTKQKSDWTLFTTPKDSMAMKRRFVSGSKEPFYKDLPQSTQPKVGKAPVEVWNQYAEKGGKEAIHPGSRITDIQTATPGSGVGLYGAQRKELADRLKKAFKNPKAVPILKKELGIKPKPELKVTQVPSVASSNPYRNLGVGRKESVKEGKSFAQFISESGGSPYQPYKPKPQPEPSAPPAGWKEKYLDPLKKKSPKLAEDTGTGNYKTYERERMRRKHNVPSPHQINKERKLSYMLQKDLPPPEYRSSAS